MCKAAKYATIFIFISSVMVLHLFAPITIKLVPLQLQRKNIRPYERIGKNNRNSNYLKGKNNKNGWRKRKRQRWKL